MYFEAPDGIVQLTVEHDTSEMPIKGCTADYTESYLAGSVKSSVHCGFHEESPVSSVVSGFGKIGKFFGGLFGGEKEEPKPTEPSDTGAKPATSSH